MPRRVRQRARRPTSDLDPAILGYLVDADIRRWADDLEARGKGALVLWRPFELARHWREHRDEVMAEAKRRRVKVPYGLREYGMEQA